MITVKFTFFHDVLCPFCYITSKRLMKVVKEYGKEVTVVHKAFMIISSLEDLKAAAPDEESAVNLFRGEFSILKNYIKDYDPDKVLSKGKIKWVWSLPPLMACKAAEHQGGNEVHWKYFDKLQDKFFMEGEDVTQDEVLLSTAESLGLDMKKFKEDYKSKKAKLEVIEDEEEAHAMGLRGVPAILVNDHWLIRGVPEEDKIRAVIEDILKNGEPKETKLKAYWEK
jgi:predicted DsbA family dithiol-disulfide isomerase